jgi:hypothetical protein
MIAAIAFWAVASFAVEAETVCVKYGKCISLDKFDCQPVAGSGFLTRSCYARTEQYLILWIGAKATAYHYCAVPAGVVENLRRAASPGEFYNTQIVVRSNAGRYDCRLHPVPEFK